MRITDIVSGTIDWNSVPYVEADKDTALKYRLDAGDIVIARTGASTGASAYIESPPKVAFASYLVRLKIKPEFDSRFVAYYLKSEQFWTYIRGVLGDKSAQPNASASTMVKAPFSAPRERYVQHEIAAILGSLDDRIGMLRHANASLEGIARAIFKSWFVDFDPVRAKAEGREPEGMDADTAALFPGEFDDTEHGPVPKGWTITPLDACLDFKEGPGIRNWQYTNAEDGVRFINIRCIKSGDLDIESASRVSNLEGNGKYAHFHLAAWDLVVSTSGTLGRCAIVRPEHLPLLLNTSVIRFRPIHPLTFSYLHGYLHGKAFLDELNAQATGSVQRNFGPMHLKRMKMLRPDDSILTAHERIVRPLFEKILLNRSLIDNLATLRDTLLPRLISGKLRVPEAEKLMEAVL